MRISPMLILAAIPVLIGIAWFVAPRRMSALGSRLRAMLDAPAPEPVPLRAGAILPRVE